MTAQESAFRAVIIQRRGLEGARMNALFGLFILVTLALALIALLAARPVAWLIGDARIAPVVLLLALILPLQLFSIFPLALLERELAMKPVALVELLATLVQSVTTLLLAALGHGYWAIAIGMVAGIATKALGFGRLMPAGLTPRFHFAGLADDMRYGWQVASQELIVAISSNFDVAVIGRVLGAHALGLFRTAHELVFLPAAKLMPILNRVAFPGYAQVQEDRALIGQIFRAKQALFFVAMLGPLWGLAAVAPEFSPLALGPNWTALAPILTILGLAAPFYTVFFLYNPPLDAIGRADLSVRNNLVVAALLLGALLAGVGFGVRGVALGYAIGLVAAGLVTSWMCLPALGVRRIDAARDAAPALMAGLALLAAVLVVRDILPPGWPPGSRFAALVAAGAAAYLAMLGLTGRALLRRARRLLTSGD